MMGQHAALVAVLLMASGALAALVLALRKVRTLAWWSIPVGLFGGGIALFVKALQERGTRIEKTEKEIVALLDQLDPVAKAQVAIEVAEAELGKS